MMIFEWILKIADGAPYRSVVGVDLSLRYTGKKKQAGTNKFGKPQALVDTVQHLQTDCALLVPILILYSQILSLDTTSTLQHRRRIQKL